MLLFYATAFICFDHQILDEAVGEAVMRELLSRGVYFSFVVCYDDFMIGQHR
ncbi:MAG: hypothetical protein ACSLEM_02850 [Candidatus Malihini olakiniferum]